MVAPLVRISVLLLASLVATPTYKLPKLLMIVPLTCPPPSTISWLPPPVTGLVTLLEPTLRSLFRPCRFQTVPALTVTVLLDALKPICKPLLARVEFVMVNVLAPPRLPSLTPTAIRPAFVSVLPVIVSTLPVAAPTPTVMFEPPAFQVLAKTVKALLEELLPMTLAAVEV